MSAPLLEIKDLHVEVEGKEILKGISLTVEKGQKEFPTNERNTNKVNVTGTIRNGKRTERRTVALAEWQVNRLAQELGAKSPADFGGETLYLHPATLQKGPSTLKITIIGRPDLVLTRVTSTTPAAGTTTWGARSRPSTLIWPARS